MRWLGALSALPHAVGMGFQGVAMGAKAVIPDVGQQDRPHYFSAGEAPRGRNFIRPPLLYTPHP